MSTKSNYDEDITRNKLFKKIQIEHPILLQTAALENWIICLPRIETIDTSALINDKDYILGHLLIPDDELPHSHFISLIGDSFQMKENQITKTNATELIPWSILFTELFYTKDYNKVNVWCISSSLLDQNGRIWNKHIEINSLEDARKCLQNQFGLKIFTHFNILRTFLDNVSEELLDVTILCNEIWKYVEEITSRMSVYLSTDSDTNESSKCQLIKKSILMIVLYETYSKCFNAITTINQRKEEEFNKYLLNLSNVSKEELGISENFWPMLSTIIKQISLINIYKTPIEKLACLKDTFDRIKIYAAVKNSTVDDLLLVIVYTILKSGYPYWFSTLSYIREFLKLFEKNEKGYNEFVLTTMEAALTFIFNYKVSSNVDNLEKSREVVTYKSINEFLRYFFDLIELNDYKGILHLLNIPIREGDDVFNIAIEKQTYFSNISIEGETIALCHPLCNCDNCQKKLIMLKPKVNACNDKGQTGLHLAALKGNPKMISILLSLGLDPNIPDQDKFCPLHYAAIKGHQNVLLLLLHGKADIKAVTSFDQSALHLSAQYGHSGCVKALLFYADHMKTDIYINAIDSSGNTALHLAAKWGFIEILESLLEYAANIRIKNQNGATAYNLSHNVIIKKLLNRTNI